MIKNELINSLVYGASTNLPDDIKKEIENKIRENSENLEKMKSMVTIDSIDRMTGNKSNKGMDDQSYTNIINLINGANSNSSVDFNGMLDNIFEKNKKYFSILKDYEVMPILIPQISRILNFLVDECISPDIQTTRTFSIINTSSNKDIDEEIDDIRKSMDLDKLLRKVYTNRYKLGKEYYLISDYKKTFNAFKSKITQGTLNETMGASNGYNEFEYLNESFSSLRIQEKALNESAKNNDFLLSDINISIEKSDIFNKIDELKYSYLDEVYNKQYSMDSILDEAVNSLDKDKISSLVDYLNKRNISDCSVLRLDPARVFKLALSGKTVGYFYITDTKPHGGSSDLDMAAALRDRLFKSRAINTKGSEKGDEKVERLMVEKLAEKIINTFDPNIGISNVEDIDLLHDYVLHNDLISGNKKITFYYSNDIIDLSREDESILINAVFFTKLYSTLLLNNITTKILRGRGRQIHTVNMGVSPSLSRYIENAISALSMPESRLGSITGSFKQLLNPLNSASDIVIPSEDGTEKYISTDLIEGQNVDMDTEMLKFLMNSIVMSFGLDSAVIDTTNGNVDFAKTLTMISYQIANSIKNEQADLLPGWEKLVLSVLSIKGSDDLKQAVANDEIQCKFFTPHSIKLNMSIDELNSAKQFADALADIVPDLQDDSPDTAIQRALLVYSIIRSEVNIEWDKYEDYINDPAIIKYKLNKDIKTAETEAKENIKEESLSNEGDDLLQDGDDEGFDGMDL